jgi:hypothetical protein
MSVYDERTASVKGIARSAAIGDALVSGIESRPGEPHTSHPLRSLPREELAAYLESAGEALGEAEACAVLDNPFCTPQICDLIARSRTASSHYSVQLRLVAHRSTPQGHAMKLIHFLNWSDLLRVSTDTRVPPPIRQAIDKQLAIRLRKLSVGEKISSARLGSRDLAKILMTDPDHRVFAAAVSNRRVVEDDIVALVAAERTTPDQLAAIADHPKWSSRLAVRLALVLNRDTPKAIAASQLRHLPKNELRTLAREPKLSTFLRRCIERIDQER